MSGKAAKRPTPRTVHVVIAEGDFAGWEATAKADFPARVLTDLQSGDIERLIDALGQIITDHNFPNSSDEVAASLGDVDPYDGLIQVATEVLERLFKLPNR